MKSTYVQKSSALQKVSAQNAASVLDASSQSKSLQRKADLLNSIVQCARGHGRRGNARRRQNQAQQQNLALPQAAPPQAAPPQAAPPQAAPPQAAAQQLIWGMQWNIANLHHRQRMSNQGLANIQQRIINANGGAPFGFNYHANGVGGVPTMDLPGGGHGRGDLRLQFYPNGTLRVANHLNIEKTV